MSPVLDGHPRRAALTRLLRTELEGLDGPWTDAVLELVGSEGDVYSRFHYEPGHVTGSAFVLHPDRDAIALVHHAKLGKWVQPGGHVEPGDLSVEGAAVREIAEEMGVVDPEPLGLVDVDLHLFPARGEQPDHHHYDVRYSFRARSAILEVGDGVTAVRWVPLREAADMDESIARPARRLLDA